MSTYCAAGRGVAAMLVGTALIASCSGDEDVTTALDTATLDAAEVVDTQSVADEGPAVEDAPEVEEDIVLPFDLGPDFEAIAADPDIEVKTPGAFDDCPTLGVSPWWEGQFEGIVTYSLAEAGADVPSEGLFFVNGGLSFQIQCLDQKFLVSGALNGSAEAAGQPGTHPFAANLAGEFNYVTRTIEAKILDGEVRLFKVVSVFFEGNFDGAVQPDGTFLGTWDGEHVGNDLGVEGDASGYGTWTANAAPPPPEPEP